MQGVESDVSPQYRISLDPPGSQILSFVVSSSSHLTNFQRIVVHGLEWPCQKDFCVDLSISFGSITYWKIQPLPRCSFWAEIHRFSINFLVFHGVHGFSGPLEQKNKYNILIHQNQTICCTITHFYAKPNLILADKQSCILFQLSIEAGSSQNSRSISQ